MLATGGVVGATTALRVAAGSVDLLARRAPRLVRLGVTATAPAPGAAKAQATFRDDLIDLARDSAELVWHQLRRGVHDLDVFTRTDKAQTEGTQRRYSRVKL
jgi:hypothetical protein